MRTMEPRATAIRTACCVHSRPRSSHVAQPSIARSTCAGCLRRASPWGQPARSARGPDDCPQAYSVVIATQYQAVRRLQRRPAPTRSPAGVVVVAWRSSKRDDGGLVADDRQATTTGRKGASATRATAVGGRSCGLAIAIMDDDPPDPSSGDRSR